MGKAYIIGTGPGDEELLTLKAVRVLKKCTAVLYDRLGATNILNYINKDCLAIYCGKKPNNHSITQEEINKKIIELLEEGHTVGRIKGGDPYVFGRGGEEVLEIKKRGFDFEVIPGVTSPVAVLNYAGIPITNRGLSKDFHVITGRSKNGLEIDFETLAKEEGTLVFMMGLGNLEIIVENLIKFGKSKKSKVGVISNGTTSKQKKVIGTLEDIIFKVRESNLKSPCIIVIGEVVSLSEDLDWYTKKPLFGKNICITRSKERAKSLKENLKDLGAEVKEINTIKIKPLEEELEKIKNISEFDKILFTSANGVKVFFDYLKRKRIDLRNLKGDICVIGNATKKEVEERGVIPLIVAKNYTQEGLVEEITPFIKKEDKILILSSKKARPYLTEELKKLSKLVYKGDIYDTILGDYIDDNKFDEIDYIIFTSPTTVRNLITLVGIDNIKNKKIISIGPQTLKEVEKFNLKSKVCKKHSEEGLLEEIEELIK